MDKKNSALKALWAYGVIIFILLQSVCALLWRFRKNDSQTNEALNLYIRKQANRFLSIMGISVQQRGEALLSKKSLLVCNHISWIDVLVIVSQTSGRFIAKAEVAHYPLIGRLATSLQTIFLNRTSIKDAITISKTVSDALERDGCVVFFPEGTTSDGKGLLPLHPSLFEAAILAKTNVQPVILRFYRTGSMQADMAPAYIGKKSLASTLWAVLRTRELNVLITGLPPIYPENRDTRRSLCKKAQIAMERELKRMDLLRDIDTPMDAKELRMQFFDDLLLLVPEGIKMCETLKKQQNNQKVILSLRQIFHVLKNRAHLADYKEFHNTALEFQICLDSWLKPKLPLSDLMIKFIHDTLYEMQYWAKVHINGGVPILNFKEIQKNTKRITYKSL